MAELEIKPTASMLIRVAGVILSAMSLVAVIMWLLTGGGVGLFARKVDVKTYMPDATGLAVAAPVRLSGIQVGLVKSIAVSGYLDTQRAIRVILRVEAKYLSRIPMDSQTSIGSDTMIGDKFVDIAAGKQKVFIADGGELRSEPADSAADKADLVVSLQNSLKKVDSMMVDLASPNTPIGHYIVGDTEYGQLLRSVDVFERDMRALVSRSNPAAQAVFSTSMYASWDKSLKGIDSTMEAMQKGQGAMGQLYASDAQYNSLLAQVRDLRKSVAQFRTSMASSAAGLQDDETYRNLTRMLASTDTMLAALNRGEGQTGQLLTNPQLYESLVGSLRSLQDFLHDFDHSPQKYLRLKVF